MISTGSYQKVASKKDLQEGGLLRVDLDGQPIVVALVSGKIYAMDAVCSHEGGPLEEGTLEGYELKCPWHGALFDVRNAKVSDRTVWATDLRSYPVKVDDATGDVLVSLQIMSSKDEPKVQENGKQQDSEISEREYYEEEEKKKSNKLMVQLLSKEQLPETDIVTFRFSRVGMDFTAGQYAFFKLDGVSADDSKGSIRHFSISSSPTEQDYLMMSTRIRATGYKEKLTSLEIGANITIWGPQGDFVLHDDRTKPAVFLSGGIGVTPFRSMIKYATVKQLPIKIMMFDSNKNQKSILYKDEFDKCAAQNKNLKIVYTITEEQEPAPPDWSGERGRIDIAMLEKHLTPGDIENAIFYVCGPPGMLKAMQEILKQFQVPKERLRTEAFTGY